MSFAQYQTMFFNRIRRTSIPLFLVLSSCGGPSALRDAPSAPAPPRESMKIEGTLSEALRVLHESPIRSACDRKLESTQLALVQALEKKSADSLLNPVIASPPASPPTSSRTPSPGVPSLEKIWIPFAGSKLLDQPKQPTENRGWYNRRDGWEELYSIYQKQLKSPPPIFWLYLNSQVRSLMLDDKRRLIYRVNPGINHENVNALPEIQDRVSRCERDPSCLKPDLGAAHERIARSIPYYDEFLNEIDSTSSFDGKRDLIKKMKMRVDADSKQHESILNPAIQRASKGGETWITLDLDPGSLNEEDQKTVESVIEAVWKREKVTTRIGWRSRPEEVGLFKILFHPEAVGERPFVSFGNHTLNLFPLNRTRSIAHEFGHVLGFDDHYYTIWDSEKCEYLQEANDEDLMSNSETGEVTPEEWHQLIPEEKPEA